ncbi:hypothetical protein [Caulobacter endophyticus]|uniref:hypothetical protein n=1 Tax=Caulobacter endophyticus TaxID=2172652 RepID=UPI00240FBBB4|nr:hypothetical protein [Caulobacter endophyticus]MDG2530312.1 hypothetical protein [Caulobacter endophyticus]
MTTKTPRTPQEKKALSYERDSRNDYTSSDKSIRRLIPLRKAKESRRVRHGADQALHRIVEGGCEEAVDLLENTLSTDVARVGGWRKWEAVSLGETVRGQLERRERLGMTEARDEGED